MVIKFTDKTGYDVMKPVWNFEKRRQFVFELKLGPGVMVIKKLKDTSYQKEKDEKYALFDFI